MVIGTTSQVKTINKNNFSISYDNQPIPLVTEAVYLGLIITNNLSWDKHVTEHCKSINYKIFQLKQLKKAGAHFFRSTKLTFNLKLIMASQFGAVAHKRILQKYRGNKIEWLESFLETWTIEKQEVLIWFDNWA